MHSGVYSKSETPVNRTLTSNPVESLGRIIMVSLMFWGGGKEARGACSGRGAGTPSLAAQGHQCFGGDQFLGRVTGGLTPDLLEVELQPLRGLPGLGGQDAIPCKAAPSAPGEARNRGARRPGSGAG